MKSFCCRFCVATMIWFGCFLSYVTFSSKLLELKNLPITIPPPPNDKRTFYTSEEITSGIAEIYTKIISDGNGGLSLKSIRNIPKRTWINMACDERFEYTRGWWTEQA